LAPLYWGSGIDITNPGSAVSPPQQIASNYTANHDNEVIIGLHPELIPNLGFNVAYTFHSSFHIPGWNPRVGLTTADYRAGPVVTANGYSAQVYSPNPAKVDASNGARILSNRPDYRTTYNGIE